MSRKIFALLAISLMFVTAVAFAAGKSDPRLDKAIQEVGSGNANQGTINALEEAFKADPQNADIPALLAAAHGILAEKGHGDKGHIAKANAFVQQAVKLGPNSNAAKFAVLAEKANSENKGDRDAAIQGLNQFNALPEMQKYKHFLLGKAHANNGNKAEAAKQFDASGLAIAAEAKGRLK